MLQPLWFRALVYGLPFAIGFGAHSGLERPLRIASLCIGAVLSGIVFGLFMAHQTQSIHARMTEAVAGLGGNERAAAISAVTTGDVPATAEVRNAAWRLGYSYLGEKTDAQLDRRERQTWLLLVLLVAGAMYLATVSTTRGEAVFDAALGAVILLMLPLGIFRTRRLRGHIARLRAGAVTQ